MPKIVAALRIAQVAGMAAGNTQPVGSFDAADMPGC